jgi:Nif-specific regulatory protein
MKNNINTLLSDFVLQNFISPEEVLKKLSSEESKILEVIGEFGSGKYYIFKELVEYLTRNKFNYTGFVPSGTEYNQLKEIILASTAISKEDYEEIIIESELHNLTNKYDFFFFLTENLKRRKVLSSKLIVIYRAYNLDRYTLDFIQYLVQSASEQGIKFVTLNRQSLFTFSERFEIQRITAADIHTLLNNLYLVEKSDYTTESEILYSLTKGDAFIIRYILEELQKVGEKLDFTSYLDKKINVQTIFEKKYKSLTKKQQELLRTIYLDCRDCNKDLYKKEIQNMKALLASGMVFETETDFFVYHNLEMKDLFNGLVSGDAVPIKEENPDEIIQQIKGFSKICDFEAVLSILNLKQRKFKNYKEEIENLMSYGKSLSQLSRIEEAVEYFRKALKLCVINKAPAEEIVFHLAEGLFMINSYTFALEVMKNYSPESINKFWESKLLILKADILCESNEFDEALDTITNAYKAASQTENKKVRFDLQAQCRKTKGKIYYYENEWAKAETEFEGAEKLYENSGNTKGSAAIFNNLGVLAMYQGNWKKTETLYLKSLHTEESNYNLKGVSICYSNLGGLYSDEGDYEKSTQYLTEAIRILSLLNDQKGMAFAYNNLGINFMDNLKFDEAEGALKKSLEISIILKSFDIVVAAYLGIGALNFKSGNWSKAIEYYENAIKKSKTNDFSDGLCRSYNNLGEVFELRGEYNLAQEYYNKSLDMLPQITDDLLKAELFGNIGSVLTSIHKFGEAYKYLVESFDIFKSMNMTDKIIEGSQKQAYYFILTHNPESAKYHLDSALELAEELGDDANIGKCYYYKGLVEKNNYEIASEYFKKAADCFVKDQNKFLLTKVNYEYAAVLFECGDWEQALQMLSDNKKIIQQFGAIKFLEANDVLIDKISKKYSKELKQTKLQETLLSRFYEITQELNSVTNFEVLLELALDKMVDFGEADGGIFALYNNPQVADSWEYLNFRNFSQEHEDYDKMMNIIETAFKDNKNQNLKQPHFAKEYTNIVAFPLVVRSEKKGVICLYTKKRMHYFTEKIFNLLNALCNQIIVTVENISYENLQKTHAVIREELASANTFTNIIGKSDKIQEIYRIIDKIKNTPTTVLLEGPSGTGKELIARAVHYNSNRRNKKFIAQYCGALPETLLESELFGHVKGSFTGAIHDKKGLFEIADGGSFFLDEIGDISLSTQAKLLRFLQEGEIKKVGSIKTETVDVRVICATNVSLKEKVEQGEFRLDLYYRLNVIKIDVPSLRQRRSDIPLLGIHFLDKYCRKISKKVNGITDEAMKYLMNYNWPGNIRQLENEVERAVTLADNDSFIKSSDLSEDIFKFQEHTETISLLENTDMKDAVEKLEVHMIINALEETNGNQTQTAKKLGLSRQGLIKKMQRYKIEK